MEVSSLAAKGSFSDSLKGAEEGFLNGPESRQEHGRGNGTHPAVNGNSGRRQLTERAAEATKEASESTEKAANAAAALDIGPLGSPIQTRIDSLRGLQETALSRAYRPDPYAERNPEFFYSGERIFKESQDKIYDGLQDQINKLEGLQASLGTLVGQNERLPQALVDALIASGFGDIAQQIVAAFKVGNHGGIGDAEPDCRAAARDGHGRGAVQLWRLYGAVMAQLATVLQTAHLSAASGGVTYSTVVFPARPGSRTAISAGGRGGSAGR